MSALLEELMSVEFFAPSKLGEEINRLTDQYIKDIEAFLKTNYPECEPRGVHELVISAIYFSLLMRGEFAVRELFSKWGPLPKRMMNVSKNNSLAMLYGLSGKPNARGKKGNGSKAEFARWAAEQNKELPPDRRLGSGTTNPDNMLRDLKRILNQKRYSDVAEIHYLLARHYSLPRLSTGLMDKENGAKEEGTNR